MRFIVIEGPGYTRKVEEVPGAGAQFVLGPGERVVGSEIEGSTSDLPVWWLDKLASYFGIATADLIKYAAQAFGIEHCALCEMRYKILHVIAKIGLFKAIKLLAKTIRKHDLSDEETRLVESSFKETS